MTEEQTVILKPPAPQQPSDAQIKLKEELVAFVKLLDKSSLKIKEATCGGKRLPYFRGEDFMEWVGQNTEPIKKIMPTYLARFNFNVDNALRDFLQSLLRSRALVALERSPQEEKKYKYPKQLAWSRDQTADEKGFYYVTISVKSKMRGLLMYAILAGIFILCLFPVWPLQVKIGVFYISVVLLYFLVGIIAIRAVLYLLVRILGVELWLFPNLFEDVSVIESFKPIFGYNTAKDKWYGYLMRLLGVVLVAMIAYKLIHEPEIIQDYQDVGRESFVDIIEWGKQKLDPNQTTISIKGSGRIKDLDTILNETDVGDDNSDEVDQNDSTNEAKPKVDEDDEDDEDEKKVEEDYDDVHLGRDQN